MKLVSLLVAATLLLATCAPSDPLPGYRPATADERIALLRTVEDYYDILNVALVTGDLAPLFARHPRLAEGAFPQRGINNQAFTMQLPSVRNHLIREAHVDIESYEPFRAYVNDKAAVAYSHGLFTWEYARGGSPTKGELLVRFDLTRSGETWSIDRTDEWVLGEGTPPPTPR